MVICASNSETISVRSRIEEINHVLLIKGARFVTVTERSYKNRKRDDWKESCVVRLELEL